MNIRELFRLRFFFAVALTLVLGTTTGLISGCSPESRSETTSALVSMASTQLTQSLASTGVKELLNISVERTSNQLSTGDPFGEGGILAMSLPPELAQIGPYVEQAGAFLGGNSQLTGLMDTVQTELAATASDAAAAAAPVFIETVQNMTITDAIGIVRGGSTAATEYLQANARDGLAQAMDILVREKIGQHDAIDTADQLVSIYNAIPGQQTQQPNLTEFVAEKTLDGMFKVMAEQEAAIRADPIGTGSEVIRRVFGNLTGG